MNHPQAFTSEALLAEVDWVRRLALRLVRDAAAADDLVQETLLAGLEQRPAADRSLRPWLASVLRNKWRMGRRGSVRAREREALVAPPEAVTSTDELVAKAEAQRVLVERVLGLRDPYRSVLLLRWFQGLEPKEIARSRGTSAATVRSQLARGLEELRGELDAAFDGDRLEWCSALLPLALPGAGRRAGLVQSLSATVVMSTSIKFAAAAAIVLAAILFTRGALLGEPARAVGGSVEAAQAPPDSARAESATSEPSDAGAQRVAVDGEQRTAAASGDVVTGRLTDERTGDPVADFSVELRDEQGRSEFVRTDAGGRFATERRYGPQRLRLGLHGDDAAERTFVSSGFEFGEPESFLPVGVVDWEPGLDVQVELHSGRLFELELLHPPGLESRGLEARLERARLPELQPAESLGRAPVRDVEERAWVRLPYARSYEVHVDESWHLCVQTVDGEWAGRVPVDAVNGGIGETVRVELVPTSAVELELQGELVPSLDEVTLRMRSRSGGHEARVWSRSNGTDPVKLALGALEPGVWTATIEAVGMATRTLELELLGGRTERRVVDVFATGATGALRGVLRTQTGTFRDPLTLTFTHVGTGDEHDFEVGADDWTLEETDWVAPFELHDVTVGDYAVEASSVHGLDALSRVEATPCHVLGGALFAPGSGFVLEYANGGGRGDLVVRCAIAGPAGPQATDGFYVSTRDGAGEVHSAFSLSGADLEFLALFDGGLLDWKVERLGYQIARGDEAALEFDDGRWLLDVLLEETGHDLLFVVRDAELGTPIPNVEIVVDGRIAGLTDGAGRFHGVVDAVPDVLELRGAGHVPTALKGLGRRAPYDFDARAWPVLLEAVE